MGTSLSIVMLCPQFRPLIGGAERQAEILAASLVASGCQVRILTPRLDSDSPAIEETNGVWIERFALDDLARRFPVRGVGPPNVPYILWQVARAVRPRLRGADILHCHSASLQTTGAALAGRCAGIPVLCKAATADNRSDLGEIEKTGLGGRGVASLARATIETWVATTEAVQLALLRAGVSPSNIVRIPNGVELRCVSESRPTTRSVRRFLYLGRLSRNSQRDVPTLVRAFDHLAGIFSDVALAIVGGGDLFEETKRLVDACGAKDRVLLPGFNSSEKWLAWADCFVLPSRCEGLSNALLEAMAAGVPCIANDILPNREVLSGGDAGMLVPVGDVHALEMAMRAMIERDGLATSLVGRAKERIARYYSISSVGEQYIKLYETLQARAGHRRSLTGPRTFPTRVA